MPHLADPDVIKSMKAAISNVSQTRSVLQSLGDRPDHETIDTARTKISEIESTLSQKIEDLVIGPKPVGVTDVKRWEEERENELKRDAEKEREIYKAVISLDEMHEAYENLLREAEKRLEGIYKSVVVDKGKEKMYEEDEVVSEEVFKVLEDGVNGGVHRVELCEKKLKWLPESVGRMKNVVSLDLSCNELKTLPDSIAGLESLEEFYLSSNQLESVPDSIGLLQKLKILDVSSNQLKALPDSISECRSLVELDAGYNALAYLPTNIGYGLANLLRLSIQYNKLRYLPSSVCEMKSLRYLDAHFNELRGLPYAIGRLTSLEVLNLGSNFSDLKELPETFGDLMSLRELDLSNNQIQALPTTFGRLDNLIKLNLEENPIVIPPMEIVKNGAYTVKEYMIKRWMDILAEEEQRSKAEEDDQAQTGWLKRSTSLLTRSTSMLKDVASNVSESVTDYLAGGKRSPRDPYLDQQL